MASIVFFHYFVCLFVCFSPLAPSYFHWKHLTGARQQKPLEERVLLHQAEYFSWDKCTPCKVCDRLPKPICAFGPSLFWVLDLGVYGRMMTARLSQEQIMERTSLCFTAHLPSVFELSRINFYWFLLFPPCITFQLGSWCSSTKGIQGYMHAGHLNSAKAQALARDSA